MPDLPSIDLTWQDLPGLGDAWPLVLFALRLGIALVLYLFLFSAFRALLVELRPARTPAAGRPLEAPTRRDRPARGAPRWLEVVACDGAADLVGRRYPLERVTLVGRDVGSTAILDDPRVSAQHARLISRNGDWWVEDLHSMNGTFIGDARVGEATRVDASAELRFGPVVARLSARSAGR